MLKLIHLTSMDNVFPDEAPAAAAPSRASMLANEVFSYQIAYYLDEEPSSMNLDMRVRTDLPRVEVSEVALVPVDMPVYTGHDARYLRAEAGLYPDLLLDIHPGRLRAFSRQWRALWVRVDGRGGLNPGAHEIAVDFYAGDECKASSSFTVEVLPARLPEQKLLYTNWFHGDCLANWYRCEVFSEEFWGLTRVYLKMAADNGMNMILTPIFTPPLDTLVGGERRTVQLVDVYQEGGAYRFGFDKLGRWIDLCEELGLRAFEFAHFFTQWGAKHAPKIMLTTGEGQKRIFGWETDAAGAEYSAFLRAFLPELVRYIEGKGLRGRSYFHVSDEPGLKSLEDYRAAKAIIEDALEGYPIIDALSNYEFYKTGAITRPIPANNHIEPFLENNVPDLWTYYCCAQHVDVSNRFIAMSGARNRVLATQLFKFDIAGFLHWGYNFYSAQYSAYPVNPYVTTSADGFVPAGDAFVVYPGSDGPLPSMRLYVFAEMLQDLRAFQALAEKIGKKRVVALIEEGLDAPIAFDRFPIDAAWLRGVREKVNRLLAERR